MCGFAGFIGKNAWNVKDLCQFCDGELAHRGPDDSGTYTHSPEREVTVGLVHRRLSIIDLTSAGHQPMVLQHDHGELVACFNGEIYNYLELRSELEAEGIKFTTNSDTEVLAAAWSLWGETCLEKFEGMFAFAIYSPKEETLTLVRDAFGIKPLYFALGTDGFGFASTPNALVDSGFIEKRVDHQAVVNYLAWGQYDLGQQTFFEGVSRLGSGEILTVKVGDLSSLRVSRWWDPAIEEEKEVSFENAASAVRAAFLRSVELHLRSDAPVGIALSGGIDSSAIVGAANFLEPEREFEIFAYCASDPKVSEEQWIDLMANTIGATPNKIRFGLEDLTAQLSEMSKHQGEPFSSSRIFAQYKVFESASQHGQKVILEGQGGDELLAGYHGFAHLRIISLIEQRKFVELIRFVLAWAKWPGRSISALFGQGFSYLLPLNRLPFKIQLLLRQLILRESYQQLFDHRAMRSIGLDLKQAHSHRLKARFRGRRVTEGLLDALRDSYIPQLVRQGDRNAMAHSVENRVPFLSVELAKTVLKLPESYLISPKGETKSVFRAAMRGLVPDELLDRRDKVGFETPQGKLWQSEVLLSAARKSYGERSSVPYVRSVDAGKIKGNALRWRYLNLALWLEREFTPTSTQS